MHKLENLKVSLLVAASAMKSRLSARTDSEHVQAMIRILLIGGITLFMRYRVVSGATGAVGENGKILLIGLIGFFSFAIVLFTCICVWPAANVPRRVLGMIADAGGTTFALFLTGDSGVGLIGVYLFVTFGNGFRFGIKSLFLCQLLCIAGFLSVILRAPWWSEEPFVGWGLFLSLIVLPIYVSDLLVRIKKAQARAEEANRAKTSFLANMSHEMRTPLNGVVGVVDLLHTTALNAEQSELMKLLRHSVALLRSLVDDVLDISKIEAGRLTIEVTDFDLYAALNSTVKMMRPHAVAKGLALRILVDPSIEYRVRGDPHHLRQVLVNLLSNAIKFTDSGYIEVTARLLGENEKGLRVQIEVRDTGIGIAPSAQKKIFEQFVQADESVTRRYGGTGLGTTIAKQLVELMGGVIGLRSAPGAGTTFWFELPLLRSELSHESAPSEILGVNAALLVADADTARRIGPLVKAACGRVETVASATAVISQLRALKLQGVAVPAVLVAGNAETACQVFEHVAAERGETPTAMIYLASAATSEAERGRLLSIEGTSFLESDASPRLLRNAIHAVTSSENLVSAEIIDLGVVLKQQRRPLRILVAEDNATNQAILRQLLESAGHIVTLASDGEEALDLYELQRPDLAIFDFNMPERSGVEVTLAIRHMEPPGTHSPIVILSASVTPETRERAQQAGADEFVGKPFDAATLLHVVDRLGRGAFREQKRRSNQLATVFHGAIPLIDRARLRDVQSITNDATFMGKLIRGFYADVELMLGRLNDEIIAGRVTVIPEITHAIKGASVGIGAQQLAARCDEVDRIAAIGDNARLKTVTADLRRCYEATVAHLTAHPPGEHRASR